jgi:hypothetical protein
MGTMCPHGSQLSPHYWVREKVKALKGKGKGRGGGGEEGGNSLAGEKSLGRQYVSLCCYTMSEDAVQTTHTVVWLFGGRVTGHWITPLVGPVSPFLPSVASGWR